MYSRTTVRWIARGATEGNYSFSSVTQTFLVRYNSIFQLKAWIEYIKWKSLSGEAKSTMSTPGHERLWCKLTYAEFDSLAVPAVVMCVVCFLICIFRWSVVLNHESCASREVYLAERVFIYSLDREASLWSSKNVCSTRNWYLTHSRSDQSSFPPSC